MFTALKALYANTAGMSYFNKKRNKWIVPAVDAAKWKPGPCAAWEVGYCPNSDDKCTCAHLTRSVLNEKNQRNGIGNYVECTLPERCKHVLKMIKRGAWSYMKDLVMADAPCLVELLEWLPTQPGGEIDVDVVQSFISANRTANVLVPGGQRRYGLAIKAADKAIEKAVEIPLSEEQELEAQDFLDKMLVECEEVEAEAFARTPAWAPNGDAPTEENVVEWEFDNFQREEEESQRAILEICEFLADYELYALGRMAEEAAAAQVAAKAKSAERWACFKPATVATKVAPTVAPAVKGVVVLDDDLDDYEWKGMDEEKLM